MEAGAGEHVRVDVIRSRQELHSGPVHPADGVEIDPEALLHSRFVLRSSVAEPGVARPEPQGLLGHVFETRVGGELGIAEICDDPQGI